MAGIGFVLRKLSRKDDFQGVMRAFFHSAIVAVGPWIFFVVTLGLVTYFTLSYVGLSELNNLYSILIYNFFFSFLIASPLYMVSARYVADCLFMRDAAPVPGIFLVGSLILMAIVVPIVVPFYYFYANLTPFMQGMSITNVIFLTLIWYVMLYLGAIRSFRSVTLSWLIGLFIGLLLAVYFGRRYDSEGMLFGINIGLMILLFSLAASILAEYCYKFSLPRDFPFYFKHYKELFWAGFLLFFGMWVDKIIMWFAPEAVTHFNNLRTYPIYDGGMFLSYLSIIPLMALFVFSLETNFYDAYIQYIRCIEHNAPHSLIEEQKKNIIHEVTENTQTSLIIQGSVSIVVILLAPTIFIFFKLDFLMINIFRLGALGAFFNALVLLIVVLFSYFDSQQNMLRVTIFMVLTNLIGTLVCLYLGFPYYGFGYCVSMILTFLFGGILLFRFLNNLTYHIFISNVVKKYAITGADTKPKEAEVVKL